MVFADVRQLMALTYSSGGGLGMGVSEMDDCNDKYKRTEGGIEMCADGYCTLLPLPFELCHT